MIPKSAATHATLRNFISLSFLSAAHCAKNKNNKTTPLIVGANISSQKYDFIGEAISTGIVIEIPQARYDLQCIIHRFNLYNYIIT